MPKRLLALLLISALFPVSVSAQSIQRAIDRSGARIAQQTNAAAARNPYKTPAIVLMAGGAGLLVIGLAQDRGAEVNTSGASVSVTEKGGSKTALTALGLAAAGGGAFLWFWGERQKHKISPSVSATPLGAAMNLHFRF
jgi:hypothetical protein